MSKKKKNIMDGYFDQFKDEVADINPHVADMVKTNNSSMENHLIIGGELLDNRPMRAFGDTNAARTQPERRDIEATTELKRSQQPGQNAAIEHGTQPERRDKGGQNAARTQPERRDKGGQNAAIETGVLVSDPTLLVGTQRQVFKYFFELTQKFASLKTPRLTMDSMSAATGLRETQIHSATKQLRQKNCIALSGRKDGRGGWVEYSVTQSSFDLWVRLENEHKRSQNEVITEPKRSQQPGHKAVHELPCSSSNLNINNTTTTQSELEPDLWLSVPKNLEGRISIRQLRDFVKQNLISAEDLQSSLDGFAYDLEKGVIRAKNGNPVAILIGAVKSGGYISQSYLSELKASLADVAKAREELQQIQAANSTQQLQEEFESFRAKFPDQAEQLKPMSKYLTNFELGSVGYKMWLEEYKKSQSTEPNLEASEAQL